MSANAADPGGEASLLDALTQHGQELDDGVDLDRLNVDDGGRIVDHVFGDSRDEVMSRLGGANQQQAAGGLGGGLIAKLLPMLAPLVMAWLAKNMGGLLGGGGGGAKAAPAPSAGRADHRATTRRCATSSTMCSGRAVDLVRTVAPRRRRALPPRMSVRVRAADCPTSVGSGTSSATCSGAAARAESLSASSTARMSSP